jgi:hypothetical protein
MRACCDALFAARTLFGIYKNDMSVPQSAGFADYLLWTRP